jgi:hypothetical protein
MVGAETFSGPGRAEAMLPPWSGPIISGFAEQEARVFMNNVNMRFDLRVPEDIYDFLVEESRLKKLSFEGLLLLYIKERMQREEREEA